MHVDRPFAERIDDRHEGDRDGVAPEKSPSASRAASAATTAKAIIHGAGLAGRPARRRLVVISELCIAPACIAGRSTSYGVRIFSSVVKVIFVNRYFFPDHSATSQLLTDLAFYLAGKKHDIHIVTSRQRYDDPSASLAALEVCDGVTIHRVRTSRFGRSNLFGRALDYLTFYRCSPDTTRPRDQGVDRRCENRPSTHFSRCRMGGGPQKGDPCQLASGLVSRSR